MSDAPRSSFLNTLGWGAYLACSWTWCIGMFLPVLMIRDFGWWSFAVFAIPNCLGAAAMGRVMKKPGTSEAVVAAHGRAVKAFSLVTMAFQVVFVYMLRKPKSDWYELVPVGGFAIGALLGSIAARNTRWKHAGSWLCLAFSLAMLVWFVATRSDPFNLPTRPNDWHGLALLAPVCIFGFGLSPYLDATFLRAAVTPAATDGSVPARFAFGFLAFFPLMIGYTLLYAASLFGDAQPGTFGSAYPALAAMPILIHIGSQLGFTFSVHAGARPVNKTIFPSRAPGFDWLVIPAAFVVITIVFAKDQPEPAEWLYRLFMSFYGLIFPAYVWICMLPTLRAPTAPSKRRLIAFAMAVICAAPFYWLGFINLQYWALAPGVMIPLVIGLLVRKEPRGTSSIANA